MLHVAQKHVAFASRRPSLSVSGPEDGEKSLWMWRCWVRLPVIQRRLSSSGWCRDLSQVMLWRRCYFDCGGVSEIVLGRPGESMPMISTWRHSVVAQSFTKAWCAPRCLRRFMPISATLALRFLLRFITAVSAPIRCPVGHSPSRCVCSVITVKSIRCWAT
ncbi:MAG: Uncharacterised protein [Prochlorococcus marinus str. MIT 9313]|nr:MAG: Uncharacterised protein [Prochlorococcus marinus str. MIT 9313]